MVIKVLISGISASKEIKKHQQRAQMLLDSLKIKYEVIDITEPGHEEEKELMKSVCKKRNNNTIALPPQFFNEDQYCGDYEDFSTASDDDTVLSFLRLEEDITIENGDVSPAPEGMNQLDNDINNVVNGDNRQTMDDIIDDEVVSEVTAVEERLTLNGQVIDIPKDKLFELKGQKIDLNELLFKKTEKLDENQTIVSQMSESIDKNKDNLEDNRMDVEEEDKQTGLKEEVKSNDSVEQSGDDSEDEEEDSEANDD